MNVFLLKISRTFSVCEWSRGLGVVNLLFLYCFIFVLISVCQPFSFLSAHIDPGWAKYIVIYNVI